MKTELHIFTNCTNSAPSTLMIRRSHNSLVETFGKLSAWVWLDPNPKRVAYKRYRSNLLKNYKNLETTASLSDGYIRAISQSRSDYLFILEHDWTFNGNISHGLDEIIDVMEKYEIYHFRFNKRANVVAKWDRELGEVEHSIIPFCTTPILSNNPHIINRKKYLNFLNQGLIKVRPKSYGIEEIISKHPDTWGAIYGGLNYPATVTHGDGRRG